MYSRHIDKIEMMSTYSPENWDSLSSLTSLLDRYLGIDNCRSLEALKLYNVSSLRDHNGAKLWRCDAQGNPLNGSLLMFDEKGNVAEYLPITRCLYQYYDCEYILRPAFFGGHLIGDTTKPVCIVEDEVTALIGSQVEKRFTWLAIGNGQNLTPSLLSQLTSYAVTLFPDSMVLEYWQAMAEAFPNVVCSTVFTEFNINDYLSYNGLNAVTH